MVWALTDRADNTDSDTESQSGTAHSRSIYTAKMVCNCLVSSPDLAKPARELLDTHTYSSSVMHRHSLVDCCTATALRHPGTLQHGSGESAAPLIPAWLCIWYSETCCALVSGKLPQNSDQRQTCLMIDQCASANGRQTNSLIEAMLCAWTLEQGHVCNLCHHNVSKPKGIESTSATCKG